MNDLAEKALHGLRAAGRGVTGRPVPALSAAGFVAASVVVVTGGRLGAAPAAVPIGGWFGLLPPAGYRISGPALGVVMIAAVAGLLGLWVLVLWAVPRTRLRLSQVWTIAAVWAVPFVIGPPVLSTDSYAYIARGLLLRRGLSPYHHAPSDLGDLRIVSAIDPAWQGERSTDGPLSAALDHLVVTLTAGRPVPALIVLRVLAVLSVVAIGRFAGDLADTRRATAVSLTVLNPAVLIFVVSAGELVGPLAALLLGALAAASRRHWVRALVLAGLAAGLKPVAVLAVPVIIAVHALGVPPRSSWRLALRDLAVSAVVLVAVTLSVPFGLGWAHTLGDALHDHVPFSPASGIAELIGLVVPATFDDLATGGRIAAVVAGAVVIGYLFGTIRFRPPERTLGFALLAAGVFAPVVYPTSLLWGLLCLAPTATGARRDWVVALSCAACVLVPVGLGDRGGELATAIALGVIAIGLGARLARTRPAPAVDRVGAGVSADG